MTNATLTAAEGVGDVRLSDVAMRGLPRSLYLLENRGLQDLGRVAARSVYLYENKGLQAISVLNRSLYVYENRALQDLAILARALYLYEATRDTEVFPWLLRLSPTEQVRGGQVDLYGDGLGSEVDVAAGSTATASSTSGANVPGQAVDRTTSEWQSTSGTAAWLRLTFATAQVVVAIALEDGTSGNTWGVPLFRFSDAGADVNGGTAAPVPSAITSSAEYPVGAARRLYTLPTPRTCTWVEVRIASGGAGTNRGLREVWVFADQDVAAESSQTFLRAEAMGIVAWVNRSPNLWPANGGLPILAAATVTVPLDAESGLVKVVESI